MGAVKAAAEPKRAVRAAATFIFFLDLNKKLVRDY